MQELLQGYLTFIADKPSCANYRRICATQFATWETVPTFGQIEDWHASLKHIPHRANKALSFLKATLNWAIRRHLYVGQNPAAGVKAHRVYSRERVMNAEEVQMLLGKLDTLPPKLAALLTVLLTTGCRLGEARQMRWEHVNMQTGYWLQPKTKNGRPHVTYLSTQARAAIQGLKGSSAYVFAGVYDRCWSPAGAEKPWRMDRAALGLADVHLHDFRRTLATELYENTGDYQLVCRCLNHARNGVTPIYIQISNEKVAAALQRQADTWWAMAATHPVPKQVVAIRQKVTTLKPVRPVQPVPSFDYEEALLKFQDRVEIICPGDERLGALVQNQILKRLAQGL